ncbi:MAG: U32 family peptidase [Brevinematia bacterium]
MITKQRTRKIELLSPAGGFDKLRFAIAYGADALYGGVKGFSLREGAKNFSIEELYEALSYCHTHGKKFYLTANVFLHEGHFEAFKSFVGEISRLPLDGILISDIGALSYLREKFPEIPIHISTQANTLNSEAIKFYEKLGVKRIVLARELTLNEIKAIRDKTDIELETFVHGAMCIAYSGRCLLSNYFTNPSLYRPGKKPEAIKIERTRDANLGDCSQACRWSYYLVETTRREDFLPVEIEDNFSTTILSSKDLSLAPFMKELIEAGIDSFKIEGRMKSIYYVANTTRVYRHCIDSVIKNKPFDSSMIEELNKISHREYTTGFFFEENRLATHTTFKGYERSKVFLGYVMEVINENEYLIRAANQIKSGDRIEVISPDGNDLLKNYHILDRDNRSEKDVLQPDEECILVCENKLSQFSIFRK